MAVFPHIEKCSHTPQILHQRNEPRLGPQKPLTPHYPTYCRHNVHLLSSQRPPVVVTSTCCRHGIYLYHGIVVVRLTYCHFTSIWGQTNQVPGVGTEPSRTSHLHGSQVTPSAHVRVLILPSAQGGEESAQRLRQEDKPMRSLSHTTDPVNTHRCIVGNSTFPVTSETCCMAVAR